MYPTLAKAGAPGRLSPVATDLTVPRMRPTIRPDVSATCHVEIKQTIRALGKKATHYQQRKFKQSPPPRLIATSNRAIKRQS
jgi:hypothetical protein